MSDTAPYIDPNRHLLETASAHVQKGELREAALLLNKAREQWPTDPRVFMVASHMAEASGNKEGALDAMRQAVAMSPEWNPGKMELALLLARQNNFSGAIEVAEKVARLEPKNLVVLAAVVDIAHRAGHSEMAIRHLRRGLALVPGDVQLLRLLASDLTAMEQYAEAVEVWTQLIERDPKDVEAINGRMRTYLDAGKPSQAIHDSTTLLEMFPGDTVYAYYSALAHGVTPEHQPVEVSRRMFDNMAGVYDMRMVQGLRYKLPKLVADKIKLRYPSKTLSVLDLGCGTGLLGVCLGRLDGFLIGVDISTKMVEQAARHGVYDRFHTVNLLDALRETPASVYEVITALDVFIYTGELTDTIPNVFRILMPAGDFFFSCEIAPEDGPDLILQTNGRYAHKRSHVVQACRAAGFETVDVEDLTIRNEGGEPVPGILVMAHKAA